jgi:hypothetical protein
MKKKYKTFYYPDDPNIVVVAMKFGDDGAAYVSTCEGSLKNTTEVMRRLSVIPKQEPEVD